MSKLLVLFIFFIVGATTVEASPKMSIHEAVNKAGYQRMLTQRIAKCYISMVAGIAIEKHRTHLLGSAKTFESNLQELKGYAPTEKIRDQFRYVEVLWRNYKFIYNDNVAIENANIILEFNNKILKACQEGVVLLEEYGLENKPYGDQEVRVGDQDLLQVINVSGRQRMLTQRIALYALAKAYNIGDQEDNLKNYHTAMVEFSTSYQQLMACSKNTTQIDEEYNRVGGYWSGLETAFGEITTAAAITAVLEETIINALRNTDMLLFAFDEIVFLYEREKED